MKLSIYACQVIDECSVTNLVRAVKTVGKMYKKVSKIGPDLLEIARNIAPMHNFSGFWARNRCCVAIVLWA